MELAWHVSDYLSNGNGGGFVAVRKRCGIFWAAFCPLLRTGKWNATHPVQHCACMSDNNNSGRKEAGGRKLD